MPLRAAIREAVARRKERQKSKRMAVKLALLLGAVIALPFAYWQFELHQVVKQPKTTEELAAICGKLDATLNRVEKAVGKNAVLDDAALDYRLSECDEMGFELTTGSVGE